MDSLTVSLVFSLITAVVSAVFAVMVLRRWHEKHRPHLLAWGIGLLLYFLGAVGQAVLAVTWSPLFYSLWYWAGAIAVAPWLGQGTIYLLVRRGNIARNIHMALILVSLMTLPWALFLTPLDSSAWYPGVNLVSITNEVMQKGGVRGFVPVMNIWGTVALVGGALYSARLFRRKQILRNRMLGNWLIAAGALFPAMGGALIRLGVPDLKYPGEMLGVILIFVGFLLATQATDEPAKTSPASAHAQQAR
ncbi:MAG: hypothetical protein DIU68_011600 [Chloroflexota bacterium]|nr:MAG: hypothetical protein DIU68_02045 [Chloroflexota bacterium]